MNTLGKVAAWTGATVLAIAGAGFLAGGAAAEPTATPAPSTVSPAAPAKAPQAGVREPRRAVASFTRPVTVAAATPIVRSLGAGARSVDITFTVGDMTGGVGGSSPAQALARLDAHVEAELTPAQRAKVRIRDVVALAPALSPAELKATEAELRKRVPGLALIDVPPVTHNPTPEAVWPTPSRS